MGWLKASVELALERDEFGARVPRVPGRRRPADEPHGPGTPGHGAVARAAWLSIGARPGRPLPPRAGPRPGGHGHDLRAPPTPSSAARSPSRSLRPEYGADAAFVAAFRREAQAAASLNHPNVVAVYDYGTDAAGPYIVMEQVAGGDLARVLDERGALPPTAVARTGPAGRRRARRGARAGHRPPRHQARQHPARARRPRPGRRLRHRPGGSRVAGHVRAASTIGSVLYFSPEQARGDTATPASDVYSSASSCTRCSPASGRSRAIPPLRWRGAPVGWRALAERGPTRGAGAARRHRALVPGGRPGRPADGGRAVRHAHPVPRRPDPAPPPTRPRRRTRSRLRVRHDDGHRREPRRSRSADVDDRAHGPATRPAACRPNAPGPGPWGWIAAILGLLVIVASGDPAVPPVQRHRRAVADSPRRHVAVPDRYGRARRNAGSRRLSARRAPSAWRRRPGSTSRSASQEAEPERSAVSSTSCRRLAPMSRSARRSR